MCSLLGRTLAFPLLGYSIAHQIQVKPDNLRFFYSFIQERIAFLSCALVIVRSESHEPTA